MGWRPNRECLGDVGHLRRHPSARALVEMAAQGVYPDGVLPGVVPGEAHAYTVVDFSFQWVELLHTYWRLTGDAGFANSMWPTLTRMLDRFAQDVADDGLIRSQPGRRLFLDWAPVSKSEPNAIYNLHYVLALQLAVELGSQVSGVTCQVSRSPGALRSGGSVGSEAMEGEEGGTTDVVGGWRAQAMAVQVASRKAFWHDGRWYDDLQRSTSSQLATALAILTKTTKPTEEPALLDAVAARSLNSSDDPIRGDLVLASPFMHHRVLEALRRSGWTQEVIDIIRLRWGRWVMAGYPTAWENWNVDFPDGSQCHGYAAHPLYHLAQIARSSSGI